MCVCVCVCVTYIYHLPFLDDHRLRPPYAENASGAAAAGTPHTAACMYVERERAREREREREERESHPFSIVSVLVHVL
jgi:hypothetical protein